MAKLAASPRVLKEAQRQAAITSAKIIGSYQTKLIKSWEDVEKRFNLSVPDTFKNRLFDFTNVKLFATFWKDSFEQRLAAQLESKPSDKLMIHIDRNVEQFGSVTLFPEQQGCYKAIYGALFESRHTQAALQDGDTGSGKTFVAAAIIHSFIHNYVPNHPELAFRPHLVIIFTPPGVVEHWKRVLELFGLGELVAKRKIYVMPDSEFSTEYGDTFCSIVEDPITGDESYQWTLGFVPGLAIFDECHRYVRWKSIRTQKAMALVKSPLPKAMLFMSATPMEKVNDAYLFTLACNTEFMGMKVNDNTFKQFAGLLDNRPDKPNREAVKRLRSVLNPYIFSLPYVKPKYKAINLVQLVEFRNEVERNIYATAHARYLEACKKSGKNTLFGQFEKLVALNNFNRTVEPLRAWYYAERAANNFKSGRFATAVGCRYKETIANVKFLLVDKYGIDQSNISLIWGGRKEFKPEDLLSKEEIDRILKNPDLNELLSNRALLKKVRRTLKYLQDQHEHSESAEEQAYRHSRLRELKLVGMQSPNNRQLNIDNFQDGTAKICLFTIATGGIGLSLDRDKDFLLPREGLFSAGYNGKEFKQLLGRLVRRASLSDAYQYTVLMRDTVEEFHVAPILDEKLKCIAEITNRQFDIVDLMASDLPIVGKHVTVRDVKQAEIDASKDNTVIEEKSYDDEDEDDDDIDSAEDLLK